MQLGTLSLATTREQKLLEVLSEYKAQGIIKSDVELQREYAKHLSRLERNEPVFNVRIQQGQTDAETINQNFQEINIDIHAIFSQINETNSILHQHMKLNQSLVNSLQLRVEQLQDSLSRYEASLIMPDAHGVCIESFRNTSNFETEQSLYTGRFGQRLSTESRVEIDHGHHGACLPTSVRDNLLVGPTGAKLANATIIRQTGFPLKTNTPLENALDTSSDVFWSETVIADEPLKINLTHNTQPGAACEIEIKFGRRVRLSEITLVPFTEYPLDIVSVTAHSTDDPFDQGVVIVSPGTLDQSRISAFTISPVSYQFPQITASRILISMVQRHYELADVRLEPSLPTEAIPLALDAKLPTAQYVQSNKYQYNYGLSNIFMFNTERPSRGIYVSKPFEAPGTIRTLQIHTDELHPLVDNKIFTDVEYYVTHKDNPLAADWVSILPVGRNIIRSELLQPIFQDGKYCATLRFPHKAIHQVMQNMTPITEGYSITDGQIVLDRHTIGSTYTVHYEAKEEANIVDFLKLHAINIGTIDEEIIANQHSMEFAGVPQGGIILLDHYPYADRKKLLSMPNNYNPSALSDPGNPNHYLPIRVKIIDNHGNHIDQPSTPINIQLPRIENASDYFNTGRVNLKPFSQSAPVYMYRVVGNELHFNTSIPPNHRVIVEYAHLSNTVRVKAILRRNIKEQYWATPVLKRIIIAHQVLK